MNLAILDVAIGLVLIYLLLSLVCSAVLEFVNESLNRRGGSLERQLKRLMGEGAFKEFCNLPGFATLKSREPFISKWIGRCLDKVKIRKLRRPVGWLRRRLKVSSFPSYIPNDAFADLAIDWYRKYHQSREWCDNEAFGKALAKLDVESGGDQNGFRTRVVEWFKNSMDRMGGRFRSKSNRWMFVIAVVVVLLSNANTFRLVNEMYRNPAVQQTLVAQAEAVAANGKEDLTDPEKLRSTLKAVPLLGWPESESATNEEKLSWRDRVRYLIRGGRDYFRDFSVSDLVAVFGFALTILALMMGADFWFNALQRLVRIRTSLKPKKAKAKAEQAPPAPLPAAGIKAKPSAPTAPLPYGLLPAASVCAHISKFAYDGDADPLPKVLQHAGYTKGPSFGDPGTETQGRFLEHDTHRVLSFRGTEISELGDIQTDLKKDLVKFPTALLDVGDVKVHEGFATGLASVWQQIRDYLHAAERPKPLLITGHSLGGGLAVLAAFALRRQAQPFPVQGVYTFGQPRTGDAAFAEAYDRLLRPLHWRAVNHRDVVPRVPTRSMGYRHVGRALYFGGDGTPSIDPTRWMTLLDSLPFDAETDWTAQVAEFGKDHFIDSYIEVLTRPGG